jgi:hypothetical protein
MISISEAIDGNGWVWDIVYPANEGNQCGWSQMLDEAMLAVSIAMHPGPEETE